MAAQLRLAAVLADPVHSDLAPKPRAHPTAVPKPSSGAAIDPSNWYKHINWLNTIVLLAIPTAAAVAALSTPLLWKTLVWAVAYYFITGTGITAGTSAVALLFPSS